MSLRVSPGDHQVLIDGRRSFFQQSEGGGGRVVDGRWPTVKSGRNAAPRANYCDDPGFYLCSINKPWRLSVRCCSILPLRVYIVFDDESTSLA